MAKRSSAKKMQRETVKRVLNLIPSPPHPNKRCYSEHLMTVGGKLPSVVDLRPNMSPVFDQGQIGSCADNATAALVEHLELQELKDMAGPEQFDDGTYDPVARLYLYWNARNIEGTLSTDSGSSLADVIAAIKAKGVCRESKWPYRSSNVFRCPPKACYAEGYHHRVLTDYAVNATSKVEMMSCLAGGFPFMIGIPVYDQMMSEDAAATGIVTFPEAGAQPEGYHAVTVVGYTIDSDGQLHWCIRNSWGDQWGDNGHFWVQEEYLTQLGGDAWTIRRE